MTEALSRVVARDAGHATEDLPAHAFVALAVAFPVALWAAHQRYDAYWKHGSVQEDYSAITCPVLAFGGWADSYTNSVPRMLENLSVPCRGVIGPWGHVYPHDGLPGPAIGWLQEAVR